MACNAASPVSTREDTNYALLNHLLVHYGTRVLRNLFDEKIPPDKLKDHLSRKEDNEDFMRLKTDGTLSTRDTLLLEKPKPSSSSYDIQLLTKLLSCLCDLRPPSSTGNWKEFPPRRDQSISAYIVRMRHFRNEIHGHETSTSMDDEKFEKNWKKVSRAIIALAGPEKERYSNEIHHLKQRGRESHETIQKLENLEGIVQSHVNSTTSELEKLKGIVRSHVKTTSAEFQRVERIVQSRFDSTSADIKEVKGFAESHVDSTSAEFEKVRGIVQSRVDSTSAEFEEMKGIVQSHVNSTSAEFKEVKGMVQSHVNSTSAEFKEVKGMIKSHRASTTSLLRNLNGIAQSHVTSAEFEEVKGMVQSHVNSTSAEFKEVKGTLTANQERTEKLLQELLERGVTHRGAENTP